MTAYNLRFSSPAKFNQIEVKGVNESTGVNISDTTLELIGNGYPDYARAISQNFLKLLENFSSSFPPENPIEGQLWYDTSDPVRKILKVNTGFLTSARWHPVGDVFRQPTDPALGYPATVNDGVLWADSAKGQLKIRDGDYWRIVGPSTTSGASKTGSEVIFLTPAGEDTDKGVIYNWADGDLVSIISNTQFIPKFSLSGFPIIKPGINLSSQISAKYNGLSEKSLALQSSTGKIYLPENFLKSSVTAEQIHTGTFIVESVNGLFIKNKEINKSINLYNNSVGSFIKTVNNDSSLTILSNQSFIKINGLYNNIGINTSTSSTSPTLDVNGSGKFNGKLTLSGLSSLDSLLVEGMSTFNSTVSILKDLNVSSTSTFSKKLILGNNEETDLPVIEPATTDNFNIGSPNKIFRTIHTREIKGYDNNTPDTLHVYGTLYGPASRLMNLRLFTITGSVTSNIVQFNGDSDVTLETVIDPSFIMDQPSVNTATDLRFVGVDVINNTYKSIDGVNLLKDKVLSGTILLFPDSITVPETEYLECNGGLLFPSEPLYSLLGGNGIDPLNLPNLNPIVNGDYTLKYFIKL